MANAGKFAIVLFKSTTELGIVPDIWISNKLCAWPHQIDQYWCSFHQLLFFNANKCGWSYYKQCYNPF
ncbi:hypothetical protein DAPPUDRAFT_317800 [Daphnia pulex]|uniref:Uncharacterized protein n=1 Tax=Daphnia pulex TaxID=6669 RepID=E9GH09_DAPPU|nr:hypothetical protein DAPPUDRAFT_317800 [Daphnia pulex]|eukprot:EFX81269.1 hypothetical protein DAPPUDRAFT_317800 [Daphnia pulex]